MNEPQADLPIQQSEQFIPPYPGSKDMPRWTSGELIEAPRFTWKNWVGMIGPGLVMGAAAIGGGEWLAGPAVTAKYGGALLWVAAVSIAIQVLYNIEISRYTLYTGEPIFNGKFRTLPGPMFWVVAYLILDWGAVFPYLAVNAAVALESMFLQNFDPVRNDAHWYYHKYVSSAIYICSMLPLFFGGKIYNSLKIVMSLKLVIVIGFLVFIGLFFSHPRSWWEIVSGFAKVGNVPVLRGDDLNGNGQLDPGEDFDHDGRLDEVEEIHEMVDGEIVKWNDRDGDGKRDGDNVENLFVTLFTEGRFPTIEWALIAYIAGLAAIAGNGGLTNTPISNFTRDQGWGMGHHVGAIPSIVGGHGVELSHVGCVFDVTEESLPRWRRWYRHVARDQVCVWMVACLIGVSLPSILSVEFLPRGTNAKDWKVASMTSEGVAQQVLNPTAGVLAASDTLRPWLTGPNLAWTLKMGTLFCGFLVLMTSMVSTIDGFVRRWVDVFWSAVPQLRRLDTSYIRYLYFSVLVIYCTLGFTIIWVTEKPGFVFKLATTGYNFAFAISCWHTVFVNSLLLPRPLRPNLLIRCVMAVGGCYFVLLGVMGALKLFGMV